jgi:hypothetical protein
MNLVDEFKEIKDSQIREEFLKKQIDRAVAIMQGAEPFLQTWYDSTPNGMGKNAKFVLDSIREFLEDMA